MDSNCASKVLGFQSNAEVYDSQRPDLVLILLLRLQGRCRFFSPLMVFTVGTRSDVDEYLLFHKVNLTNASYKASKWLDRNLCSWCRKIRQ